MSAFRWCGDISNGILRDTVYVSQGHDFCSFGSIEANYQCINYAHSSASLLILGNEHRDTGTFILLGDITLHSRRPPRASHNLKNKKGRKQKQPALFIIFYINAGWLDNLAHFNYKTVHFAAEHFALF